MFAFVAMMMSFTLPSFAQTEVVKVGTLEELRAALTVKDGIQRSSASRAATTKAAIAFPIELTADITAEELNGILAAVPEGWLVTLDLNGHTLTGELVNNGDLTVVDSSEGKTGAIVNSDGPAISNNGTLTLPDGINVGAVENGENGTVKNDTGTVAIARVGGVAYDNIENALKAVTSTNNVVDIYEDIDITTAWDNRYTGAKFTVPVTINGNGKALIFKGQVSDGGNYHAAFRFQADATVKNLTVDLSEATGYGQRVRAISSSANITVENCTFIGNESLTNTRAIIFGEGAGANIGNVVVNISGSEFVNWKQGLVDNENAQDAKSVTATGNTFTNAGVSVSAKENVTFTGNTVDAASVRITSYTSVDTYLVEATDNTYSNTDGQTYYISANPENVNTNDAVIALPAAKIGTKYYSTVKDAFDAVANGNTVTLLADAEIDSESYTIADGVAVTLDMNGKKLTVTDKKTSNYELFYIYGEMTVTGNGTIELTSTNNRAWNAMSAIFHNRGGVLTIENGTFKHLGGTDMAWVVDNSGNYYGDATTNIKGGELTSTYTAIRNRMEQNTHGASGTAILNISGGAISGTTSAIWAQAASESLASPATGIINITGGEVGNVNTARSAGAECMTTISGGTVAAFKGEVGELKVVSPGTITGEITILSAAGEAVANLAVDADGVYIDALAKIGETGYRTLQAAINAAANNDVINVLKDVNENVTVVQAPDVKFAIEGNGKTFAGTITVDGKSAAYATAGLTIKNVNFDATNIAKDASINLGGNNNIRYTNGVTVDNCTFTGTGMAKVGVKNYTGGCKNITITNCTATGMHSLAQLKTSAGVTLANNTITGCKNAVSLGASTGVNITECIIDVEGYGVRADANVTADATVTDCTIKAFIPVVVRNASADYDLEFAGSNTITATNTDGLWCAIGTSEYETNGNMPTAATGQVDIALNDAGLSTVGIYGYTLAGQGTEDAPYLIRSLNDLVWFRDNVNAGNNYQGKFIRLAENIDLNNAEWTPIATFNGVFDGNGKTISNLVVNGEGKSNQGFFGQTNNGEIKNLTINNATVKGRLNVGVVAGTPYTSKYTNIKVTGNVVVEGMAYVGGVGGKNAYANWTDITVDVNAESYVKATSTESGTAYRTYVGGVIGFNGEGGHTFKNISSNIKVIGDVMDIGGIFGILHYGNKVETVTFAGQVEAPAGAKEVGAIAGVWHNQVGQSVTINNATIADGSTVKVGGEIIAGIAGGAYNPDNETSDNSGSLYVDGKDIWLKVAEVVGGERYQTLAEALDAAPDGATVKLLYNAEKDAPIAMNGAVYGKSVTITGTATVDWSKGFLFVGRGGAGNGTVTFDGANLTSASDNSSTGIHVSGREKNTDNKYDGTVVIKNSTIVLDYLINKGTMSLDNSTLTVKNGFSIGGRPASETVSGEDATATISLANNSKVVVNNHNGMGLGYEAIGEMTVDATSTFEHTQDFLVTAKGTMDIKGTLVSNGKKITNNGEIKFTDVALTGANIEGTGTTRFYNTINFNGANSITSGINGTPFQLVVNQGANLLISRFVLGYDRNITVYGEIEDASTFNPVGQTPSLKFNSTSGVSVGGTGVGNITAENAYIELDNSSWKNSQATHTWNFKNCYVSATSLGNNNGPATDAAKWDVTFNNSVVAAKNYIKNGKNTTYSFENGSVGTTGSLRIDGILNIDATSSVTTTAQQNNVVGAVDEHGGINGTANIAGTLTIGSTSKTQLEVLGGTVNVAEGATVALGNNSLTLDATSTLSSKGSISGAITAAESAKVEISGGSYTQDVTDWCVLGYVATKNADGTYSVADDPTTHYIADVDGLKAFRDDVNAGNTYEGITVHLTADIDLAGENWTPIGNITYDSKYKPTDASKVFSGVFNGNGKVISNLKVESTVGGADTQANVGLFGITGEGAVIKDLTLTNVNINTDGRNVGAIAGFAYKATLKNITVNGNIQIEGGNNVAGIAGMTRYYDMSATDITVSGANGSAIVGNNIVGGIFAEIAPNGSVQEFKGLNVENVAVTGVGGVGGIVGLLTTGAVENVSVKDVVLTGRTDYQGNAMGRIRLGSVAGLMGGKYATIANETVENVTAKNLDGNAVELPVIGANYDAATNATEAKIGNTYYNTLLTALDAAKENETIVLISNIDTTEAINILAGKKLVLDLNGKTITGTDNTTASYGLININPGAELTINDATGEGAIKLTATNDRDWNAYSSVISNQRGKLVVNGGTIEHLGGTDMAYGIDNLTNGKGTYAETVINGGTIKSTYRAIRQFLNGIEAQNILTINGGTIEGANKSVWMQDPSKNANTGTLTIAEDAKLVGDVYLYVTPESTSWPVEVSIAAAALQGESKVMTGNVPAGYELAEVDGTYGVYTGAAKIGTVYYATIAEAINAAQAGETVVILAGEHAEGTIKLPATLKNVTFKGVEGAVLKDMTIMAHDGNTINYEGLTFDGIVFENSRISITGWRNGDVAVKDFTVKNCTFKNLNDTSNSAPLHFNMDADEAVNGLTFTNNVIDGATGGSKSGIYAQVTGKTVFSNNVINNVAFRPYVVQLTTNDGVADEFVVTGNTFSGSAAGRAQGLGNSAEGTDSVKLVVSNNIFKDITDAQQICYWNFNEATTEAVLEKNYYDINIIEKANRFYFNSAAQDASDLVAMGIFPYYTELNADGTINEESLTVVPVAVTANTGYATVTEAIKAAADGATVEILAGIHDEVIAPWAGDTQHTSEKSITIVGSKNFGTTLTAGMYLGYDDSQCREHNIVVKGIVFKGKGLKVACQQNVTIEGNKFADITEGQAIAVIGKNINSVVKNNVIENVAAAQGIELRNTLTATVEGNTISGTAHNSLQITSQVGATNSSVTVKDNTMSNWGTAGEGRAMRINNIVTADINGNVMSHTGAPEEFVKVTGSTTLNAAANYWNGVSPLTAGMFTGVEGDPIAALQSYYTDSAKSNLVTFTTTESAAIINGSYYETLAAAVTAVKDGETITLLKTCSENVTIQQVKTKSFTIDGNNNTYTGTITVQGDGTTNNTPTETLTFRNINFELVGAKYAITSVKGKYARNITVENCSFKGENSYGIRVRNGYNYTLKNVTVDGFYSFFNATESLSGLTVENVTVTNTGSAFNFSYATGIASLKNVNIDVTGNGIWFQNRNASTVTLENCSIKAATPINIVEAVTNTNNFVFNGTNNFTATNGENWLVINDDTAYNATFNVTVNDANLDIAKTSGLAAYAKNSERSFGSNKFLNVTSAMADGDVVTLVADVALDTKRLEIQNDGYAVLVNVKDKAVTIDLNGKNVTVNASADDLAGAKSEMLLAVFHADLNGRLTLTDNSTEKDATVTVYSNDAKVYSFGTSENAGTDKTQNGTLTINGGTYFIDRVSDSMFFTDANEKIVINGGNFTLGNTATGDNGSPWIFNVVGRNAGHVIVNGGTFNADINHQFWANEVFVPQTLALKNNGDDTWTVVDAVAYAVERATSTGSSDRNIGYATVAEAVEGVRNGGTVTLLKDIEFAESFVINNEKTIIFDGDGHKLTQADGYTDKQNGLLMLGATSSNDGDAGKRNYTIKNVVFDGITGWSAIRSQGVTLTVDNCTFQNCQQTNGQAMIRLDYTEADIKNSVFEENNALMAITHNFNADDSQTKLNVEECVFQDNTFNKTAGIYYVCGGGCTISNSEFIKNRVNCNANGAVIYLGFQENCKVTGNLFKENVVADASTSTRVAGAIFFGYDAEISGNVFDNNTASNANGDVLGQVCTSTYYDCAIDLGDNYWGGEAPVYGEDYTIQHQTGDATFALDSYYTAYTLDENGNVVLSDLVELVQIAMVGKLSYTTLQAAVDAADNATVILLNSVEGAGVVISNDVTIDFAGYTYTVNKAVGSAGTETLGFQILKDNNVTLKNGVLTSTTPVVEGKEVKMLIQNYANLTLEDIDLVDNTDHILYVLSNNSGTTAIQGATNITTDAVAFDVYDYTSGGYAVPTVNINTTGVISGNIEVSESIQDNLNIYNGTYDLDVNKWCADGFTAAPNTDGTYSVVTGARFIDGQFTAYTNPVDMEVDYIRYERNGIPTTWTTFYVPFEVPVSQLAELGIEVAYINGVRRSDYDENGEFDEGGFSMELIMIHGGKGNANGTDKTLKANYPYFIRSKGSEPIDLYIELEDALLYAAKNATYDCSTFTEKFEITGTAATTEVKSSDNADKYIISRGEWSRRITAYNLAPFRFYMTITSRDDNRPIKDAPASMSIVVRGEELPDGTTLIYDIEAETGDEFIFDLTGRRVLETEKGGIYIKNGKKVLVK